MLPESRLKPVHRTRESRLKPVLRTVESQYFEPARHFAWTFYGLKLTVVRPSTSPVGDPMSTLARIL